MRRIGAFMSDDEVAGFSAKVDIAGLRAYWDAVGQQTEVVASTLRMGQPLDAARQPPQSWNPLGLRVASVK